MNFLHRFVSLNRGPEYPPSIFTKVNWEDRNGIGKKGIILWKFPRTYFIFLTSEEKILQGCIHPYMRREWYTTSCFKCYECGKIIT